MNGFGKDPRARSNVEGWGVGWEGSPAFPTGAGPTALGWSPDRYGWRGCQPQLKEAELEGNPERHTKRERTGNWWRLRMMWKWNTVHSFNRTVLFYPTSADVSGLLWREDLTDVQHMAVSYFWECGAHSWLKPRESLIAKKVNGTRLIIFQNGSYFQQRYPCRCAHIVYMMKGLYLTCSR